jgi:cell division protein FtsZ
MRQAELGIAEMRKNVDTMIVVPNERLLAVVGKGIPFQDALKKADEVLLHATQGISSLISVTGLVNVDFADVRTVMQEGGSALMGTGIGRGENRAIEAAQQAIASPLLDNVSVSGATGVLVNITGGADLTLGEVHQINEIIHDAVGEDAEIIFGAVHEPAMQGEIRVTVIATGFDRERQQSTSVQVPSLVPPQSTMVRGSPVIPLRPPRGNGVTRNTLGEIPRRNTPTSNPPVTPDKDRSSPEQDLSDMEIPTFIRRQMD